MDYIKKNELVAQAIQGNRTAFAELCACEGKRILYSCIKIMGNLPDGEDAAQEVFIKMHKGISTLSAPESFAVWIQLIVRSVCINMRRKKMNYRETLSTDDCIAALAEEGEDGIPQQYIDDQESRRELLEIINILPQGMQACIRMYYFDELTTPEIAQVMGVSESSVRNQLVKARRKLREALEAKHPGAYMGALLPMSAITAVFNQEADELVSSETLQRCLHAAGKRSGFPIVQAAGRQSASAVKLVVVTVSFLALLAGAASIVKHYPEFLQCCGRGFGAGCRNRSVGGCTDSRRRSL